MGVLGEACFWAENGGGGLKKDEKRQKNVLFDNKKTKK
jgi:hypothetical protein